MSEAQGFAHPEFLAETDWLAAHLNDPNVIVLDGTVHLIPDPKITYTVKSGREDFEKGHIPGAQFVDLQADLSAKHPKLRFMMPNAEEFAAAMGRFGVGESAVCPVNALAGEQRVGGGGTAYGRPGRLAKSVSVPAASLIDPQNGAFLPATALRAKFDEAGAFDKKQVITYCGGGIAASADALALVMLGHPDVRLYDASMSDWANDPSLPMETG